MNMARGMLLSVFRLYYFSSILYIKLIDANVIRQVEPVVESINVINEVSVHDSFTNMIVELRGFNFHSGMRVRAVRNPSDSECFSSEKDYYSDSAYNFHELWSNSTYALMALLVKVQPIDESVNLYVCVSSYRTKMKDDFKKLSTFNSEVIKWKHQGDSVVFRTKSDKTSDEKGRSKSKRHGGEDLKLKHTGGDWKVTHEGGEAPPPRQQSDQAVESFNPSLYGPAVSSFNPSVYGPASEQLRELRVYGFRVESSSAEVKDEDGVSALRYDSTAVLRLFGAGWHDSVVFTLTEKAGEAGDECEFKLNAQFQLGIRSNYSALLPLKMPLQGESGTPFYLCYKDDTHLHKGKGAWKHVGSEPYLTIVGYQQLLPIWLTLLVIVICLMFSSLFSGLNLGLMSLNQTELKIISNTGTETERRYADMIIPIRKHGNFLLCSILLGNVMVNSTFTILLDGLTSGLVAVIASTLAIVILGEISPQAICSRHGLAIGARTIAVTKMVMLVTSPLAYPISRILDLVLGEEIGAVYTRERLKELVKLQTQYNDLKDDEVNIISGALELRKKIAGDVMTKLEDVYMLSVDAVLDFETVSEIMKSGFSRIPVYETARHNIITMFFIKDLALVDPDDNIPLKTLCQFYENPCYFVFEDTTLDILFKQFKEGNRGHMAFVHRVNSEGDGDPFYETVGIITLEDVIEEIIQAEIMDETDVWTDNRSKHRRGSRRNPKQDFTKFAERSEIQRIHISPQLTLATFQYLNTSCEPFKSEFISESVLSRLLRQDIIHQIKVRKDKSRKDDPHLVIYQQGRPVDFFILILEGRVEVTVGRENLIFESGPFTYFGLQALTQTVGVAESPTGTATSHSQSQQLGSLQSVNLDLMLRHSFVPDYTVRAVTDIFYLRVRRSLYLAAKRATLMERCKKNEEVVSSGDVFDDEVEKLLHSLDDDDTRSQGSPEQVRTRTQGQSSGHTSPSFSQRPGSEPTNNGHLLTAASEPILGLSPSRTPPRNSTAHRSAAHAPNNDPERTSLLGGSNASPTPPTPPSPPPS